MIEILIMLLLVIDVCIFTKCMIDLNKHISELEKKINYLQYQTDDVLCDINIVNENVLNTNRLVSGMEDENGNK